MGAQNFNFDPKFPQNKSFQLQTLHFSTKNFWQEEDFPTVQNLTGRGGVPPATAPLIALKYEAAPLPFVVSGAPAVFQKSVVHQAHIDN